MILRLFELLSLLIVLSPLWELVLVVLEREWLAQLAQVELWELLEVQVLTLQVLPLPCIVSSLASFFLEEVLPVLVRVRHAEESTQVISWEPAALESALFCLELLRFSSQHIFIFSQQAEKQLYQLLSDFQSAWRELVCLWSHLSLYIFVSFPLASQAFAQKFLLWPGTQVFPSEGFYFRFSIFPWRIELFYLCTIFLDQD